MNHRNTLLFAACSAGIAVILGAFGAHGLQNYVSSGVITEQQLHAYESAVRYQLFHSLALLAIPALDAHLDRRFSRLSSILFTAGILLFSGSLYLLSAGPAFFHNGFTWAGPITPLGGLCFITGWVLFLCAVIRNK